TFDSNVSFWPASNEITFRLDMRFLRLDRELAAGLGFEPRGYMSEIIPSPVTFREVVVHWPKLVEELQAAGFAIRKVSNSNRRGRKAAPLSPASETEIHKAITQVYDDAASADKKPPNVKEVVAPAQAILRRAGYEASGLRI